jgi:hypothetical protein
VERKTVKLSINLFIHSYHTVCLTTEVCLSVHTYHSIRLTTEVCVSVHTYHNIRLTTEVCVSVHTYHNIRLTTEVCLSVYTYHNIRLTTEVCLSVHTYHNIRLTNEVYQSVHTYNSIRLTTEVCLSVHISDNWNLSIYSYSSHRLSEVCKPCGWRVKFVYLFILTALYVWQPQFVNSLSFHVCRATTYWDSSEQVHLQVMYTTEVHQPLHLTVTHQRVTMNVTEIFVKYQSTMHNLQLHNVLSLPMDCNVKITCLLIHCNFSQPSSTFSSFYQSNGLPALRIW